MNNKSQSQVQHFATLKSKYQATQYEDSSPSSFLYLILRKADLEIEITDIEWNWLLDYNFLKTIETIEQKEQRRKEELNKLKKESELLIFKYKATKYSRAGTPKEFLEKMRDEYLRFKLSPLIPLLWKIDSGNKLSPLEVNLLRDYGLTETIAIAQQMERLAELKAKEIQHFATLKVKYKATKHQDSSPDSPLYKILKKLDAKTRLSDSDVTCLKKQELVETIEVFQQQEATKQDEFVQLKDKYQATKYSDTDISSPLYSILQNLDADKQLSESEIDWLEKHELIETLDIILEIKQKRHFVKLKIKYKATQYEDASPSSHLYKVLQKIESDNQLGEQDINFLKKRKLTDTITIVQDKYADSLHSKIELGQQLTQSEKDWLKINGRENIIAIAQTKHFATLKSKYDVLNYQDKLPSSLLYSILQKLEKAERLEPTDVAWLQENKTEWRQLFSGKIFNTYHKIEATFYEQEYQRTGNQWNLPNASSHWRKANKPRQALKLTEHLNFDKIKENKLKSALMTTRGGAFRDIEELDKAEKCALKAIEYQPNSHHPYTLMGAICYEKRNYIKGDYWFEEAVKRGASPRDQDAEIKRVVKNTKDEKKRREVVEYLLKKDPQRYTWAKSYLKITNRKK